MQYHRLAILAEPNEVLAISAAVIFQDFFGEISYWFSPVNTWLEEEAEVQHLPGYGDIVTLERRWYYTPIEGVRGIPGRMMAPLHLYLGTWPDIIAYESLPEIPGVGSPQPVPLYTEE